MSCEISRIILKQSLTRPSKNLKFLAEGPEPAYRTGRFDWLNVWFISFATVSLGFYFVTHPEQ